MSKLFKISFLALFAILAFACDSEEPTKEDPIVVPDFPVDSVETVEPGEGIQIVLFTPSGVELPDDYIIRMKEVTDYTEWFFNKWMNYWGYSCEDPIRFKRYSNGDPVIWTVVGQYTLESGAYDELGYSSEVISKAQSQYAISDDNQTWWIISYPGPESSAYRGGGDYTGGTSSANFSPNTGVIIETGDDCLSGAQPDEFLLKATIHELTHALGMPHIGSSTIAELGNSLMGPTTSAFQKYYASEEKVHLSQACACMLWKHPLFAGSFSHRDFNTLPTVKVSSVNYAYDADAGVITVSGYLTSNLKAHSVVISNDSDEDLGSYWVKGFVGEVADDGYFSCEIDQLINAGGVLTMAFCFDNGAVCGASNTLGLNKGITKLYTYQDNAFKFD